MSNITEIIDFLKTEWGRPREAIHRGNRCPFLLECSFVSKPAEGLDRFPMTIPNDLQQFWLKTKSATLFKDKLYGQWGIEVLEPADALRETARLTGSRPEDSTGTDLVVGRFFGDSDLIVASCDVEHDDFGSVTIALPIDKRIAWPVVASSFQQFLERLIEFQGDKYWET